MIRRNIANEIHNVLAEPKNKSIEYTDKTLTSIITNTSFEERDPAIYSSTKILIDISIKVPSYMNIRRILKQLIGEPRCKSKGRKKKKLNKRDIRRTLLLRSNLEVKRLLTMKQKPSDILGISYK